MTFEEREILKEVSTNLQIHENEYIEGIVYTIEEEQDFISPRQKNVLLNYIQECDERMPS